MPDRVVDPVHVPFTVVTASGVQPAAPTVTQLAVPRGVLEAVDVQIPPGHRGVTGIRVALAGQQIFPWSNTAAWLIGDDMKETFEIDVQVDTGLTVATYNMGAFPHTHYLRLRVRQLAERSAVPSVALLPNESLGAL